MKHQLVIVTGLGCCRAYRLEQNGFHRRARLKLDELRPVARGKIVKNVAGNLVKTDKSELLQRF